MMAGPGRLLDNVLPRISLINYLGLNQLSRHKTNSITNGEIGGEFNKFIPVEIQRLSHTRYVSLRRSRLVHLLHDTSQKSPRQEKGVELEEKNMIGISEVGNVLGDVFEDACLGCL